jgi:hypothetical protein
MEKPMVDALAQRLEKLERGNRRWKCVAGVTALGLALSLALGGLLGSRTVVAQQTEKAGNPALRRMEYKVIDNVHITQMEKALRNVAAEGWEVVQVVPTDWSTTAQGQTGRFERSVAIARRPMVPGR